MARLLSKGQREGAPMSVENPTKQELQELLFRFPESNSKSRYQRLPVIPPIELRNVQVTKLVKLLGKLKNPELEGHIRQQIKDAAKYFPNELMLQNLPAPSHLIRKFKGIQSAAVCLRKKLNNIDDTLLKSSVFAFLLQGIDEYAHRIRQLPDCADTDIPWNFWTAYRLPSALQSIELLEHWTGLAIERLTKVMNSNKQEWQQRGYQGKRTHKGKSATRVLIHRLAIIWSTGKGILPVARLGTQMNTRTTGFVKFSSQFVKSVEANVTKKHEAYLPQIKKELELDANAIQTRLKTLKERLKWEYQQKMKRNPQKSSVPQLVRLMEKRK